MFTLIVGITERGRRLGRGTAWCTLLTIDPADGRVGHHRKLVPDLRRAAGLGAAATAPACRPHAVAGASSAPELLGELDAPGADALYAEGEDLHVGVWPGCRALTGDITRFIAHGGAGVVARRRAACSPPMSRTTSRWATSSRALGPGAVQRRLGRRRPRRRHGSSPGRGRGAPHRRRLDCAAVRRERLNFDPTGHYSRPDVLALTVDRRRHEPVVFVDGP